MKASELIAKLQELVGQHGDADVAVRDNDGEYKPVQRVIPLKETVETIADYRLTPW